MSTKEPRITSARMRVLRHLDGSSIRQIGAALGGITPNAVHQQLREARKDGLAQTDGSKGGWRLTARGETILRALRGVGL